MKRFLLSVLSLCAALSLRAQICTPEAGVQFQGLFVNDEFFELFNIEDLSIPYITSDDCEIANVTSHPPALQPQSLSL